MAGCLKFDSTICFQDFTNREKLTPVRHMRRGGSTRREGGGKEE